MVVIPLSVVCPTAVRGQFTLCMHPYVHVGAHTYCTVHTMFATRKPPHTHFVLRSLALNADCDATWEVCHPHCTVGGVHVLPSSTA